MPSAASPSQRGHCIQVTDNIYYCRCLSFALHASPLQDPVGNTYTSPTTMYSHLLDSPAARRADTVSTHTLATLQGSSIVPLSAIVLRACTTQERIQLVGNTAVLNPHLSTALNQHLQEPFKDRFQPEQGLPPHTNITRSSSDVVAAAEPITSLPMIPDPYHPTDWMYRMTLFTGSESVSEVTHPHPDINLTPAYAQADASYSLDDAFHAFHNPTLQSAMHPVHGAIASGFPWFIPPASPLDQIGSYLFGQSLTFTPFQSRCAECGHGIHGHVDYVSIRYTKSLSDSTWSDWFTRRRPKHKPAHVQLSLPIMDLLPVDLSNIAGLFMDTVQVSGLSSSVDASNSSRDASNVTPVSDIYAPSVNVDSVAPDIIQPQAYDLGALPRKGHTATYLLI
ncbi:hypothetical protein F5146DRAFT_1218411 [Armillaria mellea]|nr:hypothetical protein F5146DRAFT_1218411 [Armillaria mellea]